MRARHRQRAGYGHGYVVGAAGGQCELDEVAGDGDRRWGPAAVDQRGEGLGRRGILPETIGAGDQEAGRVRPMNDDVGS